MSARQHFTPVREISDACSDFGTGRPRRLTVRDALSLSRASLQNSRSVGTWVQVVINSWRDVIEDDPTVTRCTPVGDIEASRSTYNNEARAVEVHRRGHGMVSTRRGLVLDLVRLR